MLQKHLISQTLDGSPVPDCFMQSFQYINDRSCYILECLAVALYLIFFYICFVSSYFFALAILAVLAELLPHHFLLYYLLLTLAS